MPGTQTRTIGSDVVVIQDARVVVSTSVEMPDWEVRQHRAPLIRFDGRTWRVAGRTTADGKIRYELAPWIEVDEHVMGREIEYGAAYVAARDRNARVGRKSNRVTLLLRLVSPFVGFLPARTKGRLEAVYGVDPVATTFQSVLLEAFITFVGCWMTPFSLMFVAQGPIWALLPGIIFFSTIAAGVDGIARYGRLLKEERPPPGLFEWLFRRRP